MFQRNGNPISCVWITPYLQCGHRYYASVFFRDFQNVFHDIFPGVVWEVSSEISCSCSKSEYFLIKIARFRRKKRKSGWPTILCKLAKFVFIFVPPQIYEGSLVWNGFPRTLWYKEAKWNIPAYSKRPSIRFSFHIIKNNFITSTSNDLMKILSIYASNNVFNINSKQIEAYWLVQLKATTNSQQFNLHFFMFNLRFISFYTFQRSIIDSWDSWQIF